MHVDPDYLKPPGEAHWVLNSEKKDVFQNSKLQFAQYPEIQAYFLAKST